MTSTEDKKGFLVSEGTVQPEWIDCNGHMNVAYYLLAFDKGVDALWTRAGLDDAYIASRMMSTFAVETHITYQRELQEGEPYEIRSQILALDEKRIHQFQRMYHADKHYLAATGEFLNLHVNLESRRVCPWPEDILDAFTAIAEAQVDTDIPLEMGKQMRVDKPLFALDKTGN